MRNLFLFVTVAGSAWAEPVCGPAYSNLIDHRGARLPSNTPYIAWVEQDADTAMVFRQTGPDIEALILRLREGGEAGELLSASYWQQDRCRIVSGECRGTCPDRAGRKQVCSLYIETKEPKPKPSPPAKPPWWPKPPVEPKPKPKQGPHGEERKDFAQAKKTQTIRCICRVE
ncbi:MAG: hypothetical protein FJW39_05205 [Acidobacteria bacterium]|nr:hypothetical protein [Acidobacteriota bacterium]